jgi:hypothetical protein
LGKERGSRDRIMGCTSFEPRPNPDTTLPFIRRGNGASGPESRPMIVGRGPSGRISLHFSFVDQLNGCKRRQRGSSNNKQVWYETVDAGGGAETKSEGDICKQGCVLR